MHIDELRIQTAVEIYGMKHDWQDALGESQLKIDRAIQEADYLIGKIQREPLNL
jgi:hypothetical protein